MKRIKFIETSIKWYCKLMPIERGKTKIINYYSDLVRLGGDLVYQTDFGALMHLDLSQYVQRQIFFRGSYERNLLNLFNDFNREFHFGLFIDIGANVGQHSLYAIMDTLIPRAIAFEVSMPTFLALRRNIEINGLSRKIEAVNSAVMDYPGYVDVSVPDLSNDGTAFVSKVDDPNSGIEAVTLDSVIEESNISESALMKIDVEGAELRVLMGARKLLEGQKIKVLMIEVCERHLQRFGDTADRLFQLLSGEYGYTSYLLSNSGKMRRIIRPDQIPPFAEMIFVSNIK